jgi:hypothetical protein
VALETLPLLALLKVILEAVALNLDQTMALVEAVAQVLLELTELQQ